MKKLKYILISAAMVAGLSSCSDYLEIYPENAEPVDKFWSSKEDVESSLFAGYYYLRSSVTQYLIPWGELRAGCVYDRKGSNLQTLRMKPTDGKICSWATMYQIVNQANLVIANASKAQSNDDTYTEAEMNSHLCEAYFMRALAYFYLVRNWREVPVVTSPFETDEVSYNVGKSNEAEIFALIKSDLQTAIRMDAAKEKFNTTWETKGRATKWAIYALMTDVCLWTSDFEGAIAHANAILNSTSANAPRFMTTATHSSWFTIFNPGNSNESIFELQWSHEKYDGATLQTNTLPTLFDYNQTDQRYQYSTGMMAQLRQEYTSINTRFLDQPEMAVRTQYGSYIQSGTNGYVWKYFGGTTLTSPRTSTFYDPNFIIYRVADVMLMKAEALIMRHMGTNDADNQEAVNIVNEIRHRTNLLDVTYSTGTDFITLMTYVIEERVSELAGEGKAWYDFLRVGHYKDPNGVIDFKTSFLINNVIKYNDQASESWIKAVLSDENAWYLPIYDSEIKANQELTQNPYYL